MAERAGKIRVYADTSVYGGVLDDEFARASRAFFEGVRRGRFGLVASALVEDELAGAPGDVRGVFDEMLAWMERGEVSPEVLRLRRAYVEAGIVGARSSADALHVAVATVSGCGLLISWNCRHIVNFRRIPMYNTVNRLTGWDEIAIHTPLEVVDDEDEDV